ncbi:unnamed protein product, partial [Symbiodinium sp. KB8]
MGELETGEFFRDLLQPGFVNRRIESLKKKLKSLKKDKNESEVPFRFRFLDVTVKSVSEEQVCDDFNFPIVLNYCATFAGDLPTKKEVEEWASEEAGILRTFCSWACDRAQRKGALHEKMDKLKLVIQTKKQELAEQSTDGKAQELKICLDRFDLVLADVDAPVMKRPAAKETTVPKKSRKTTDGKKKEEETEDPEHQEEKEEGENDNEGQEEEDEGEDNGDGEAEEDEPPRKKPAGKDDPRAKANKKEKPGLSIGWNRFEDLQTVGAATSDDEGAQAFPSWDTGCRAALWILGLDEPQNIGLATRTVLLCLLASMRSVYWYVEQPASSVFPSYPYMVFLQQILDRYIPMYTVSSMGAYGHGSVKPTVMLGNALGTASSPLEPPYAGKHANLSPVVDFLSKEIRQGRYRTKSPKEDKPSTPPGKAALRRPQTTDQLTDSERKTKAQRIQKSLDQEFKKERAKSPDAAKAPEEEENEEPSSEPRKGKNNNKAKATGKAKTKSGPKTRKIAKNAKPKKTTKVARSPSKSSTPKKLETEEEAKENDKYVLKDHGSARSSNQAPSPRKPKAKAVPSPPSKKASQEQMKEEEEEEESVDDKDKKTLAHKLCMRFWRSVHGSSPSANHRVACLLQYLVLVEDEQCGEFVDEISDLFQMEAREESSDSDGEGDSSDDDDDEK